MAGPEGSGGRDRFWRAELQAAAVHLIHDSPGDGKSRFALAHQPVVGGQAKVDAGPHLQGVGAVGIERGAIAAQTIGHPEPPAFESFKTGLFDGLKG